MLPTVDVIVVSYNHKRFMEALFEGLLKSDYPKDRCRIFLVDNASQDGTADEMSRLVDLYYDRLPPISVTALQENTGFAGGNNLIMKASDADYFYLLNPDAAFESSTLREIVEEAEKHPNTGSLQSLLVLMKDPSVINSTGNDIHFAGHGYCNGYLDPIAKAPKSVLSISYASGAGVLYRRSALEKVGYFDEVLFAYHEDLDLGWRLLIAGYENLLVPQSVLRHHYEFSRSIKKWYWMERNRGIVVLTMYRWPTIILLLPGLLAIEIVTWFFAILRGWIPEKVKATFWFFKLSSWKYLHAKRKEMKALRKVKDSEILKRFVFGITHQEADPWFMKNIANPLMGFYYRIVLALLKGLGV